MTYDSLKDSWCKEIDIPKAEEHYHKIANLATTQKAKAWVREAYEISVPLYLLAEVK